MENINEMLLQGDNHRRANVTKTYIYNLRNKLSEIGTKKVEIKNDYGEGYYLSVK